MQKSTMIRKRSTSSFFGLPIYDIALGPNLPTGEPRGHARGILAIGDIATGWLAIGGIARGIIAFGGIAFGVFSIGGCAIGIVGLGGLAIGALALGGAAVGYIAIGGAALGYYALGGAEYVIGVLNHNSDVMELLRRWIPWMSN
jgi:hypothetical protein